MIAASKIRLDWLVFAQTSCGNNSAVAGALETVLKSKQEATIRNCQDLSTVSNGPLRQLAGSLFRSTTCTVLHCVQYYSSCQGPEAAELLVGHVLAPSGPPTVEISPHARLAHGYLGGLRK